MISSKEMYLMPENLVTSWASEENPKGEKGAAAKTKGGRKGAPCFPLAAGEAKVLAEVNGQSGTIRRIWVTVSDRSVETLCGLRLDFYWDNEETPAVSAPLGNFFGVGLGYSVEFQSALFTNPEGRSFNCYVPMPFKKGMKVTVTNESKTNLGGMYYDINYTLGDFHGDDMLYFHAHYRRENPTVFQKDYEILPKVCGKGRFLGCNIGVKADTEAYFHSWWGEGEIKIYLDGDNEHPTLCGTGTEDYIGTGWGQGRYSNLYQGCPVADGEKMHYCFYRYHIPDPVYFHSDIRVTIQQLGRWDPDTTTLFHKHNKVIHSVWTMEPVDFSLPVAEYNLFERRDDWSSCAYFYLDAPANSLPEIDCFEKRI